MKRPLLNLDGFAQVVGGSIPARIWHDSMPPALRGTPVRPLRTPSVSRLSAGSVAAPAPPAMR